MDHREMTKLYIIGNGFDKHHDLNTGYSDFHKFVMRYHPDIENDFEEYFQLRTNKDKDNKDLWSDFESDLGTFNWKSFFDEKNNLDIQDESFRPSYVFGLEDDLKQATDELIEKIRDAFEKWLKQISLESTDKKLDLEEESVFLNFNYTLTLEKVYKISSKKIFHIHGDVETDQGCLTFGHNQKLSEELELDENGDSNRTMFTDSENAAKHSFYAFQKPVGDIITKNKTFFESIRSINEIIILGHSLNPVDIPYFEEIKRQTKNTPKWKVSFCKEEEKETHLKTLREIGVAKGSIEFFKMK